MSMQSGRMVHLDYRERVSRATKLMDEDGLDALLLSRPHESRSLYYLTGIDGFCADLVLFRDGGSVLLVLDQDLLDAREIARVDEILTFGSARSQFEAIAKVLRDRELERGVVGVEKAFLRTSFYESLIDVLPVTLQITDASKVTGELRLIKTDGEIELIRRASAIAKKTLKTAAETIRPESKENEIAGLIDYELRREGAEGTAASTFVSSGSGTKAAHPPVSTRRLSKGGIVTIDLHPRFQGYCSDLAATFTLDVANRRLDEAISRLLEVRDAAIQAVKIRDKFSTIHLRYLEGLSSNGFIALKIPFFNNIHGIGVAANDPPSFWYPFDIEIQPGMVFAFAQSPAVLQSEGVGIRFEDTYLATKSGVKRLTSSQDQRN